jgi:hypothetical protein
MPVSCPKCGEECELRLYKSPCGVEFLAAHCTCGAQVVVCRQKQRVCVLSDDVECALCYLDEP